MQDQLLHPENGPHQIPFLTMGKQERGRIVAFSFMKYLSFFDWLLSLSKCPQD